MIYSWVSYEKGREIAKASAISEQADLDRITELDAWQDMCPEAPEIFRATSESLGGSFSVDYRLYKAGECMYKLAKYRRHPAARRSCRDYHQ